MARLLVHVEGETEESFVNEVLAPHLHDSGFERVAARLMGNARLRGQRGGVRSWSSVKGDITRHLREDRSVYATTLVDYYGMPRSGDRAWPGRAEAPARPRSERPDQVERAMEDDIARAMGEGFDRRRFVGYVAMHEFEGLLFSDCGLLSRALSKPELEPAFVGIRSKFPTPEDINDTPQGAPSRRLLGIMPEYQKPLHGTLAALSIGLQRMCEECPHFGAWVARLEGLAR